MISLIHMNLSSSYLPIQIYENMIQDKHYLGPHLTFKLGLLTRLNPQFITEKIPTSHI